MKIVQINTTCGIGSTGKICTGISQLLTANFIENYILYSSMTNGYELGIPCSNAQYIKTQAIKSKLFGSYGFYSKQATQTIIKELERIQPDIVHIHNIHGHDCNIELLFNFFKEKRIKLIWTFHDCWAFTGYCTYFTVSNCNKWQNNCYSCIQRNQYSWIFDKSEKLYTKKKFLFSDLDLTIVTPSNWLANLVKKSFLKNYPIEVIHNGIDTFLFKPYSSDFRDKYNINNKKIILGVSFEWSKRKGLDVFEHLATKLSDDYQIVLVGTNNKIKNLISDKIIAINYTKNQKELAEIYASANVFVNPTREDNFPTVNIEALACGTPVVTFNTGGSPECIDDTCGSVVEYDNIDAIEREIIRICTKKPYNREQCLIKSREFDKNERFKEYLKLYERINIART